MKSREYRKEKIAALRSTKPEELKARETHLAEEIAALRFKHGAGQLESPTTLWKARQELAWVKTLLRETERKA